MGSVLDCYACIGCVEVPTSQSIDRLQLQDNYPPSVGLEFNGTGLGTENGVWQR